MAGAGFGLPKILSSRVGIGGIGVVFRARAAVGAAARAWDVGEMERSASSVINFYMMIAIVMLVLTFLCGIAVGRSM